MSSEWIEHDGKGMPVDGETVVFVKFGDGGEDWRHNKASFWHDGNPRYSFWVWNHDRPGSLEIEAYSLLEA